ncbi:hypothetical protein FRC10_001957 [Ceratobasidium sp. 414]|nr:hypothetical protein FRC10_001957 [Ceratobasidium sp. 414]
MSVARLAFIITTEEMVKTGQDNKVDAICADDEFLARLTAKRIIEYLLPVGWIRLHDATIDGKPCYAFMLGKRNTPPERVSPITVEELSGLFGRGPQRLIQGDEKGHWSCGDQSLVLEDIILYDTASPQNHGIRVRLTAPMSTLPMASTFFLSPTIWYPLSVRVMFGLGSPLHFILAATPRPSVPDGVSGHVWNPESNSVYASLVHLISFIRVSRRSQLFGVVQAPS